MSTDATPMFNELDVSKPDPTTVLELVAATVPLPPATAAALRLVCRATKRAVDHAATKLSIPWAIVHQLSLEGDLLTSGLTSLIFKKDPNAAQLYEPGLGKRAVIIAQKSVTHLETLHLGSGHLREDHVQGDAHGEVLALIGAQQWPKLRSLAVMSTKGIFETHIGLDTMPLLAELTLSGALGSGDVAAMCHASHLSATLEVLDLRWVCIDASAARQALGDLLKDLPRLRCIALNAASFDNLECLGGAGMPKLESLRLDHVHPHYSLLPIATPPRHCLTSLTLSGIGADHENFWSNGSTLFPALRDLDFCFLESPDWSFMHHIDLPELRTLRFRTSFLNDAAVADIAAGLNRLKMLESLELDVGEEVFILQICSRLSLPWHTQIFCVCQDNVLNALIGNADNIPLLEEVYLQCGHISSAGFSALAEAGHRGAWLRLKAFGAAVFKMTGGKGAACCRNLLRSAWPGLTIQIGREMITAQIVPAPE